MWWRLDPALGRRVAVLEEGGGTEAPYREPGLPPVLSQTHSAGVWRTELDAEAGTPAAERDLTEDELRTLVVRVWIGAEWLATTGRLTGPIEVQALRWSQDHGPFLNFLATEGPVPPLHLLMAQVADAALRLAGKMAPASALRHLLQSAPRRLRSPAGLEPFLRDLEQMAGSGSLQPRSQRPSFVPTAALAPLPGAIPAKGRHWFWAAAGLFAGALVVVMLVSSRTATKPTATTVVPVPEPRTLVPASEPPMVPSAVPQPAAPNPEIVPAHSTVPDTTPQEPAPLPAWPVRDDGPDAQSDGNHSGNADQAEGEQAVEPEPPPVLVATLEGPRVVPVGGQVQYQVRVTSTHGGPVDAEPVVHWVVVAGHEAAWVDSAGFLHARAQGQVVLRAIVAGYGLQVDRTVQIAGH